MRLSTPTTAFDRWEEIFSDRLNPMLVREMRQSFQSRQFVVAFGLVLVAAWLVSAVGVMKVDFSRKPLEPGGDFFVGYHAVLDLCLFLIVPVNLFRGMSSEFREQEFEVLAITTLRAERIVLGKLQSAFVQAGIYLSAFTPFLCMTLLMGGIGLWDVLVCLLLSLLNMLLACLWGGMLGALSKRQVWEAFNMLLLIAASFFLFSMSRGLSGGIIRSGVVVGVGEMIGFLICAGALLFFGGAIMLAITIDQFQPTIPYQPSTFDRFAPGASPGGAVDPTFSPR